MSKATSTAKTKKNPKPAKSAKSNVGPLMFGRDIFIQALERAGVEVIFAYPGVPAWSCTNR